MQPSDLRKIHKKSSYHRAEVVTAYWLGCFHCQQLFTPRDIKEWIDSGFTAMCPKCGIDSVLPFEGKLGDNLDDFKNNLREMNEHWHNERTAYAMDHGKMRLITEAAFHEEDYSLRDIQRDAYEMAAEKGFWDDQANVPTKIALIHTEISEALEEYRKNTEGTYIVDGKPEGLGVELADAVIRICDLAEHLKVDLASLIRIKMRYNKTRPFKHGNKKI